MHFDIDVAKIWSRTHLSFAHAPEDYFLARLRTQPTELGPGPDIPLKRRESRTETKSIVNGGGRRESDGRRRAGKAGGAGASPLFIVLKSLAIR
jgi:hypothetical protein